MSNVRMSAPTGDKGTTKTGPRAVVAGVITRRAGRQTTTAHGPGGSITMTGPLVDKGDTRRMVAERLAAGGAR